MTVRPASAVWFDLDTKQSGRGFGLAKLATGETDAELRPWYRATCTPGRVEGWPEFRFQLARGGFADLQPANRGFWLFSERLRSLVEELSPQTPLQWLEQEVASEDGNESRVYWSPALLAEMDVWRDGSVVRGKRGYIIHAELDPAKVEGRGLIAFWAGDDSPILYVHRELLEATEERGCASGMKWSPLPKSSFAGGDI